MELQDTVTSGYGLLQVGSTDFPFGQLGDDQNSDQVGCLWCWVSKVVGMVLDGDLSLAH